MAGVPVTEAERETIRDLHAQGWSATRIGKTIGRPAVTVSRAAARMSLTFDHSQTAKATKAAAIDMKARRAVAAERLLSELEGLLDDLHRPYLDHAFSQGGNPDERYTEHPAMPTPSDKAQLMRAATSAGAEHRRMAEFDTSDDGADHAKSMLGRLFSGLAEAVSDEPPETPQDEG